jgi:hypothetical protein
MIVAYINTVDSEKGCNKLRAAIVRYLYGNRLLKNTNILLTYLSRMQNINLVVI